MSNTNPPKTQHRKLKRRATQTPSKTQHRKLKRWVRVAHLFIFLCCVFGGFVLLIFLVFCFLFFWWIRVAHLFSFLCCVFDGVCVARLFSFLCCVFGGFVLLIFLVFCFLLRIHQKNRKQKTKKMSNTDPPKTQHRKLKR
jgi:ABC-type Fe3+ transport system permease subunit